MASGGGRGGRSTGTLTTDQLQTLGCIGKDIPQVTNAPPPTFPPLINKPTTLEITAAQNYQILWKEDFLNRMRDYFVIPISKKKTDLKYSDQYNKLLENSREKCKSEILWDLLPEELKLSGKRKSTRTSKIQNKRRNPDNVLERLDQVNDSEINDDVDNKEEDASDSEKDVEEEQEIQEDDEMDDENDYGNNYFDNGEAFNEEDDNLDDGPIF